MSKSIASEKLKNAESDDHSQSDDDDTINAHKFNTDLSSFLETKLGNKEDEAVVQRTAMPKDLRKYYESKLSNAQSNKDSIECQKLQLLSTKAMLIRNCHVALEEDRRMKSAEKNLQSSSLQITSIDGFFNRKRGRPPKNRFIEVYKNTNQKPQAIFTSFKLEKHGSGDAVTQNSESTLNYSPQMGLETSRVCENDTNTAEVYPGSKPFNNSTTQHKRLNRFQIQSSMHRVANGKSTDGEHKRSDNEDNADSNDLNCMKGHEKKLLTNVDEIVSKTKLFKFEAKNMEIEDETLKAKRAKTCGVSSSNVTVIRSAGTYYPENSEIISEIVKDVKEEYNTKLSTNKRSVEKEDDLQFSNVTHDLSVRQTSQSSSSILSLSMAASSLILPQIYNAFQMQQQLLGFYQQMGLLSPSSFPYINPKLSDANSVNATSTLKSDEIDLTYKKKLYNTIINLQKSKSSANIQERYPRPTKRRGSVSSKSNMMAGKHAGTPMHFSSVVKLQETQFHNNSECTPAGYLRFRFNEDCGYDKCSYRQHQSHFHCNRPDCQHSFCDKTRFVQHTARHERLDTLMGSDFQQYRVNMNCRFNNCPYDLSTSEILTDSLIGRKSSHFHCLRCKFVCADTNKVVAHRRLHSKMEFVRSAGFRKVSTNENCLTHEASSENVREKIPVNTQPALDTRPSNHCPYAMRHAHYHCLICNCSILSRSQLLSHKHRTPGTFNGPPEMVSTSPTSSTSRFIDTVLTP
ncbi:hypothetical protein DOY81_008397 [Sarcophaga bullata]|nr:hypothetical protein DOY81_008397 [Sarcophaga bullata]